MGFHVPPFYSVPHLHMHTILPPFNNKLSKLFKYIMIMRKVDAQIEMLKKKN
jgi:hypothetical protein